MKKDPTFLRQGLFARDTAGKIITDAVGHPVMHRVWRDWFSDVVISQVLADEQSILQMFDFPSKNEGGQLPDNNEPLFSSLQGRIDDLGSTQAIMGSLSMQSIAPELDISPWMATQTSLGALKGQLTDLEALVGLIPQRNPNSDTINGHFASELAPFWGFPDKTSSVISFSYPTFTITPTHNVFRFYLNGLKYFKNAAQTVDITNTEGNWFFSFNALGILVASQSPFDLFSVAPVASLYWDVTNAAALRFCDERHGPTMDQVVHDYLHDTVGTRFQTGLLVTGSTTGSGGLDVDAELGVSNGEVHDEDISIQINNAAVPSLPYEQVLALPAQIPVWYRDGASSWRRKAANNFPVLEGTFFSPVRTRCSYNQLVAGSWTQTEVANLDYFVVWIFATNSIAFPIIAILGQRTDGTLANAQNNNTYDSIDFGTAPFQEFKVIARVLYQPGNGYANIPKVRIREIVDYRTFNVIPGASVPVATVHASLTGLDYSVAGHTGFLADTDVAVGARIAASANVNPPIDTDLFAISDAASANILSHVTWLGIKGTLKTYTDTLYAPIAGTMYIGTTAHALNRASAPEDLAGITGLTPAADFTLTQNAVVPFTSVEAGAIVNTLVLKTGSVGVGVNPPLSTIHTAGNLRADNVVAGINAYSLIGQPPTSGFLPAATDSLVVGRVTTISANIRSILVVTQATGALSGSFAVRGFIAGSVADATTSGSLTSTAGGGGLNNRFAIVSSGSAVITQVSGLSTLIQISGTGTFSSAAMYHCEPFSIGSGTTITDGMGLWVRGGAVVGTFTNRYGVRIDNLVGGINRWGIYQAGAADLNYFAGNVGIGIAASVTSGFALGASIPRQTTTAGLTVGDAWIDTTGGLNILKIV